MTRKAHAALVAVAVALSVPRFATAADDAGVPTEDPRVVAQRGLHGDLRTRKAAQAELVAMGEPALPAAIVTCAHPNGETETKWCEDLLDGFGMRTAADQVQVSSEDTLVHVLEAFGETKDVDALPAVFPFVGSDRAPIRNAARSTIVVYGDRAAPQVRAEYNKLGGQVGDGWTTKQLVDAYFAQRDELRLHDVVALFDDGVKMASTDLPGGVKSMDAALAREPLLDSRAKAAPFYLQYARTLEPSDRDRAREYALKTERLAAPSAPEATQAAALLALMDADDLRAKGIASPEAYAKVLALDPSNEAAKKALSDLGDAPIANGSDASLANKKKMAIAGMIAATAIFFVCLFFVLRRRED
ncbi:MAG TPA: hypothetical protein VF407_11225 [Polyangiaceae bacterium]